MTLNEKNFDSYRKFHAIIQPQDLHATVDELLANSPYRVTIEPLTLVDPELIENEGWGAIGTEYWVKAEFSDEEKL